MGSGAQQSPTVNQQTALLGRRFACPLRGKQDKSALEHVEDLLYGTALACFILSDQHQGKRGPCFA